MDAENTLIFILCAGRSGSTWLSYVLGGQRDAACLGEYYLMFSELSRYDCTLCHAKALDDCEVLRGFRKINASDAFPFAFDCFKDKRILIDNSKNKAWTERGVQQGQFKVKIIHLLRDPRGWFASQRRREPMNAAAGVERWLKINRAVIDFTRSMFPQDYRNRMYSVFYEDLVLAPAACFPPLCSFIGTSFTSDALRYWEFDHHGPAGNGAAFSLLTDHASAEMTTGDDEFYRKNAKTQFLDTRWHSQLSQEEIDQFVASKELEEFLKMYGKTLL